MEKDIVIKELLNEAPCEKIVLDIQDTRRYFESQTGGQDELKINESVSIIFSFKIVVLIFI